MDNTKEQPKTIRNLQPREMERENPYRTLVEDAVVGVYILQENKIVYTNSFLRNMTGYSEKDFMKIDIRDLFYEDEFPHVFSNIQKVMNSEVPYITAQFKVRTKSQTAIETEIYGASTIIAGKPALIGTVIDITERKRAEEQIKALAYFDTLTGLPNRFYSTFLLEQELEAARLKNSSIAVFFLDFDRFKLINDTF